MDIKLRQKFDQSDFQFLHEYEQRDTKQIVVLFSNLNSQSPHFPLWRGWKLIFLGRK
jgi:hypothetical protein